MYPRLLHIYGPLWIYSYGVMIAVGFVVFIGLTLRHSLRKTFISKEIFLNTIFAGFLGGVIGGRMLHVVVNMQDFLSNPLEIFYPWVPGFAVLGSMIGALGFVLFYLARHHVPILPMLDLAALYAPLFQSIARFGCLFAGCCYGCSTHVPWAIIFSCPEGFAPLNIPLHPAQLYASLASFIIFVVVQSVFHFITPRFGVLFGLYLMLENIARFIVDFWRGDRGELINFCWMNLSIFQIFSFIVFVLACISVVVLWVKKPKKYKYLS